MQGAQSSKGASLFTPLAGGTVPVAAGVGDAVGLSPSSPPNTGHSIHVFCPLPPSRLPVSPSPLSSVSPPRCFRYPFLYHRTPRYSASRYRPSSRSSCLSSSHPSGTTLPLGEATETHDTTRAVATPVAGELRSSADVPSPRLDVDDGVDVHTRSSAWDTGAYHGTGPKRISDVRQLRLKLKVSVD